MSSYSKAHFYDLNLRQKVLNSLNFALINCTHTSLLRKSLISFSETWQKCLFYFITTISLYGGISAVTCRQMTCPVTFCVFPLPEVDVFGLLLQLRLHFKTPAIPAKYLYATKIRFLTLSQSNQLKEKASGAFSFYCQCNKKEKRLKQGCQSHEACFILCAD